MSIPYKNITIVGLGLMGGAFAKALSTNDVSVFGVNRSEKAVNFAKDKGWIYDGSASVSDSPKDADLVLLCGATWTLPSVIEEVCAHVGDSCSIMDISSVKKGVLEAFEKIKSKQTLLSCHPMVGSEKSGIEYSDTLDFSGKTCLMIEDYSTLDTGKLMLQLGFIVDTIKASKHDELLAVSSHFPYLIACLASKSLQNKNLSADTLMSIIGSGFLSTSRVSESPVHWGVDMCSENKHEIKLLLTNLKKDISSLESALDSEEELTSFLDSIQKFRSSL
ncbi:hypothetical protein DID80_03265 [Candidatus Marinamargulisbacteria bacterium SCGC AAA071-K20]|nr:hypothetical protein DID80_03265 [Candidatus Marinamargulisbacteria bacterium SCGC AAA071-K20]